VRNEGWSATLVEAFVERESDAAGIDMRHIVTRRRVRQQRRLSGERATVQRRSGKTEVTARFVKSLLAIARVRYVDTRMRKSVPIRRCLRDRHE
jgi:hypothetical protein